MTGATPPSVWVARGVLVAGVLLGLLGGLPAGYRPPVAVILVVVLAATWSAFRPEHLVVTGTFCVVVVWWTFEVHDSMPVAVVVAAAGLVTAHAAATVLAYGPSTLPIHPRLALLWARRAVLVWLASVVVWGVARAYNGQATPSLFWLTGLAAAIAGAVGAGMLMPFREERGTVRAPAQPVVRRGRLRR